MTWATSVPILVVLGLTVVDLGPYATDVRQHHRLMPPPIRGRAIITRDTMDRCKWREMIRGNWSDTNGDSDVESGV